MTLRCRPRERGTQYSGNEDFLRCGDQYWWLGVYWVPAFAGTTAAWFVLSMLDSRLRGNERRMRHALAKQAAPSHIHLQRRDERLLRDVDLAVLAHLLLAFLLLLQQLAFARDVAAVALGGHVLTESTHGLARDHLATNRGLDRHLEHVRRNELFQLFCHGAAARLGACLVHQHRK